MDPKERIKHRVDLADLIGEYLDLKPTGTTGYRALCPFHQEKTPSLHVSKDKEIWKCFGCGEGGDCFSFLMKIEGMDFPEALRHLGKRTGVEVKRFDSKKSNERQRLIDMNELAEKFFRKVLTDATQAAAARKYLEQRSIPSALQERFGIGYAPDSWDALVKALGKRGFKDKEGVKAGLFLSKRAGTGVIDRFRHRIMIPIRNRHGNTVGFTGRILPGADDDKAPKYMNSPETPIYHKGRLLFGLDVAKHAIKKADEVVVVEGNLDVVASHKANVENVVASSGTALTTDQIQLLQRYTDTLIFAFDADAAGFDAARKGMRLAKKMGCEVRVATIPEGVGKDPDDVVQNDPEIWRTAVQETVPVMEYYITQATANRDLSNIDDKRAAAKILLPELAAIQDAVERDHWLQHIADMLRTDTDALRKNVQRIASQTTDRGVPRQPSTRGRSVPDPQRKSTRKRTRAERAGILLLGLFIQYSDYRTHICAKLREEWIPGNALQQLYKTAVFPYPERHSDESDPSSYFAWIRAQIETQFDASQQETLVALLDHAALEGERGATDDAPTGTENVIDQLVEILQTAYKKRQRKTLESQIRQAEQAGNTDTVERLFQKYNDLQS